MTEVPGRAQPRQLARCCSPGAVPCWSSVLLPVHRLDNLELARCDPGAPLLPQLSLRSCSRTCTAVVAFHSQVKQLLTKPEPWAGVVLRNDSDPGSPQVGWHKRGSQLPLSELSRSLAARGMHRQPSTAPEPWGVARESRAAAGPLRHPGPGGVGQVMIRWQ